MIFDFTDILNVFISSLVSLMLGISLALIYFGARYDQDKEEEFGDTCTKSKHYWQLDPKKDINYCFCGQESWKTDDNNLVMIKS